MNDNENTQLLGYVIMHRKHQDGRRLLTTHDFSFIFYIR